MSMPRPGSKREADMFAIADGKEPSSSTNNSAQRPGQTPTTKSTMSPAGGQPAKTRTMSSRRAGAKGGGGTTHMDPGFGDVEGGASGLGGSSIVNFPEEIGTEKQPNYMTFRCWKITSAVGGTMGDTNYATTKSAGVDQVSLPIPTGIGTNYGQGWDQADVNATQGGLMRATGSAFGEGPKSPVGDFGAEEGVMAAAKRGAGQAVAEAKAGGSISSITSKIAQSGLLGNAIAGTTLGMAGKVLGGASSTALGVASFNQTMAFYQGPKFREFGFGYQLIPHSGAEQYRIRQIIDFFKTASAPEQISAGLFRIYEIPFVFSINFYGINGENQYINKIAKCALVSVEVKYGGDRFNTFADTDAPVQTNLDLKFKEIELITKTEMLDGY
jgi:hypothetical protein